MMQIRPSYTGHRDNGRTPEAAWPVGREVVQRLRPRSGQVIRIDRVLEPAARLEHSPAETRFAEEYEDVERWDGLS